MPVSPDAMIDLIESALAESPVGVVSFTQDGTSTTWSRQQAYKELAYWRRRKQAADARAAGASPLAGRFTGLDMSGGMS